MTSVMLRGTRHESQNYGTHQSRHWCFNSMAASLGDWVMPNVCSDNSMDVLRPSFVLLSALFCLGCQQEKERESSPPDPFEMTISTTSKYTSIEDAEITERKTVGFSNLVDVQNRLRSLDWQNTDLRYEIEIIRRENARPEAKMDIKHLRGLPRSTELVFREDLTKPNNKTRIEVGEGMTADMVATMTGQLFEHATKNQDEGAKEQMKD